MPRIDESAGGAAVPAVAGPPAAAHGLGQAADEKPLCKPAAIDQQDAPLAPAQSQDASSQKAGSEPLPVSTHSTFAPPGPARSHDASSLLDAAPSAPSPAPPAPAGASDDDEEAECEEALQPPPAKRLAATATGYSSEGSHGSGFPLRAAAPAPKPSPSRAGSSQASGDGFLDVLLAACEMVDPGSTDGGSAPTASPGKLRGAALRSQHSGSLRRADEAVAAAAGQPQRPAEDAADADYVPTGRTRAPRRTTEAVVVARAERAAAGAARHALAAAVAASESRALQSGPCMNPDCEHPHDSPQWRKGPGQYPVLCNACGTRWLRNGTLRPLVPRRGLRYKKPRAKQAAAPAPASPPQKQEPLSPDGATGRGRVARAAPFGSLPEPAPLNVPQPGAPLGAPASLGAPAMLLAPPALFAPGPDGLPAQLPPALAQQLAAFLTAAGAAASAAAAASADSQPAAQQAMFQLPGGGAPAMLPAFFLSAAQQAAVLQQAAAKQAVLAEQPAAQQPAEAPRAEAAPVGGPE